MLYCALLVSLFFASTTGRASSLVNEIPISEERQDFLFKTMEENRAAVARLFEKKHWGLEIIIAGPSLDRPESIFGHVLIRFLDDDQDPINDDVIGFQSLHLDESVATIRAFEGGDEVIPVVDTFAVYLQDYTLLQSRSTVRLILPSNQATILKIKQNFARMISVTELADTYKFQSNNCASVLLKLLGSSGYPTPWKLIDMPTYLDDRIRGAMITYSPNIELPSLNGLLWPHVCGYLREKKGIQHCTRHWYWEKIRNFSPFFNSMSPIFGEDAFWTYLSTHATPFEKSIFVNLWPSDYNSSHMPGAKAGDVLIKLTEFGIKEKTAVKEWPLSRIIPDFPRELYRLCERGDEACRADRLNAIKAIWGINKIDSLVADFPGVEQFERNRAKQLVPESAQSAIGRWLDSAIVQDMIFLSRQLKADSPH